MTGLWFLHYAIFLVTLYQCIEFHSIPLYIQRYALDQHFIALIKNRGDSVNTGDRVTVFKLCNFPYDPLSVYQVSFNSLVYFQRYAPDKLFI